MRTIALIARAAAPPARSPQEQLLDALGEAIADARQRREAFEEAGLAGTVEHMVLCSKLTRWRQAWRLNR